MAAEPKERMTERRLSISVSLMNPVIASLHIATKTRSSSAMESCIKRKNARVKPLCPASSIDRGSCQVSYRRMALGIVSLGPRTTTFIPRKYGLSTYGMSPMTISNTGSTRTFAVGTPLDRMNTGISRRSKRSADVEESYTTEASSCVRRPAGMDTDA